MKNPYALVNKANSAFNSYLEKLPEFEEFMKESISEQEKINQLIFKFMDESRNEQEKINQQIEKLKEEYVNNQKKLNNVVEESLELSKHIVDEINSNKKSIENLNFDLENIKNINEFNQEKTINLIKKSDKQINKTLNYGQNKIINSISKSYSEVDNNLNNVDSSLKGHVDGAVGGLDSSLKGYVDGAVGELDSFTESINKQNNNLESLSKNQINILNEFIESQKFYNGKMNAAVNLFNSLYNDCKIYYFNNKVRELDKYLNTGELFRLGYINNIEFVSYSPGENKLLLKSSDGIFFITNNRFYTLKEVIGFNGYSIPQLYEFDDFIVFDIGMNRAYASLWFANFENCSHVFGFEIDNSTFDKAVENIQLNSHISDKITPYNFGFSDNNEFVNLYYLSGCDGVSTMISEFTDIQAELKENKDKLQIKQVEVKKSSEIISKIINDFKIDSKIVLKIDTEGAEYKIMSDLIDSGVINKIDVILGEGHIFSDEFITDNLLDLGFKQIKFNINEFTYDFAFVKEKYYNFWHLKKS